MFGGQICHPLYSGSRILNTHGIQIIRDHIWNKSEKHVDFMKLLVMTVVSSKQLSFSNFNRCRKLNLVYFPMQILQCRFGKYLTLFVQFACLLPMNNDKPGKQESCFSMLDLLSIDFLCQNCQIKKYY